ncbi:O-antigen ligase family protein [Hymenobacter siberiensis]|jgi:O-antigen ligase|uniref:O-antigen ligase family protein n=1 Tax=Hymenobacter siberiensis TaxID=2848396 RepID=UPI001C1DD6D3|nr:O-antigen ligase family protein [Hymenobacter siberiensis]MBU6120515.1 O-antigen ligase family protein [Hymenobacter siberiensis]
MLSVFSIARLHRSAFFFCACIIISIFLVNWLRVALGIAMGGLAVTSVVFALVHKRIANRSLWPVFGSIAMVFVLHLLAGIHTQAVNMDEYRFDLGMQLPFLMLPLSFWLLPPLPSRYLRGLWWIFIAMTVLAASGATINYLLHAQQINESYMHSKVMPTEPDHIRFSIMITMAIAAAVLLVAHHTVAPRWRTWAKASIVGMALFLHLLAVRSGEMTFYALGGLAVLWLAFGKKQWRKAIVLATVLIMLPVVSYFTFPTFRNRVYNTQEDVSKVQESSEGKNFSISARVYSYQAALAVWRDNKLTGVGKPNLEGEMAKRYAALYPQLTSDFYIMPHNQYLYNLAAYGSIGLLIFCLSLFYPAWWARKKHAPLLLAQYVSIALSFLVEYTLETQIGLAFAVFFLLLALQGSLPHDDPDPTWRPA